MGNLHLSKKTHNQKFVFQAEMTSENSVESSLIFHRSQFRSRHVGETVLLFDRPDLLVQVEVFIDLVPQGVALPVVGGELRRDDHAAESLKVQRKTDISKKLAAISTLTFLNRNRCQLLLLLSRLFQLL